MWTATVKRGGKTTVLVDGGSFGKCYNAVVSHNKAAGEVIAVMAFELGGVTLAVSAVMVGIHRALRG